MQEQLNNKPWYKHKMMLLVVSVPVLSVVVSFFLIFMSVVTTDSVVDDNWYLDGKALEMDLSKDANASLFNVSAELTYSNGVWMVNTKSSVPIEAATTLQLKLIHTTRKTLDKAVLLNKVGVNSYASSAIGDSGAVMVGKYIVELSGSDWRLRKVVIWPFSTISLQPLPLSATELSSGY